MKDIKKFVGSIETLSTPDYILSEEELENEQRLLKNTFISNGREEGIQEGLEKGINLTIKNMLEKNIDIELISEITGKSIDEIKKIK